MAASEWSEWLFLTEFEFWLGFEIIRQRAPSARGMPRYLEESSSREQNQNEKETESQKFVSILRPACGSVWRR